jgi:hypothetical protein
MTGLENTAAQGWDPANPWGDDGGTPDWATYATWKPNVVRIPLNAASWLGLTGYMTASQSITFTTAPASGSTGGTLSAAWTLASGQYPILFHGNNSPYTFATFTNGSATVSWPSLSGAAPSTTAVAVTWGASRSADPGNNYRAAVIAAVAAAQAIGCYVVLDLHWCNPQLTIGGESHYLMPLAQSPFADYSTAIPFWESIASYFGTQATPQTGINNNGILFELFNEPYLNQGGGTCTNSSGATITPDEALKDGGNYSVTINNSQSGTNYVLPVPWKIAGYTDMLSTIRATGAQNVCIVNGNYYTQDLAGYTTYLPTDTLSSPQLACGWHCYEQYNTKPNNDYPYTSSPYFYPCCGSYTAGDANANSLVPANNVLAAGIPVICTEDGGFGGTEATSGEPHLNYMQQWCDTSGASHIVWQWNNTQSHGSRATQNFLTVYASDGTTVLPLQGAGEVVYDWMIATRVSPQAR